MGVVFSQIMITANKTDLIILQCVEIWTFCAL